MIGYPLTTATPSSIDLHYQHSFTNISQYHDIRTLVKAMFPSTIHIKQQAARRHFELSCTAYSINLTFWFFLSFLVLLIEVGN